MRLSAALFVVYGHGFALLNLPAPGLMNVGIHTFGVQVFFCISGYLMTDSWLRDPNLGRFLMRRALRIFPALFVVVFICVFLLGPALTTLSLTEYFGEGATRAYLRNIMLRINYVLPGVFETTPYPRAVNGSLWSLPIEFCCYLGVASLGTFALWLGRMRELMVAFTALLVVACTYVIYLGSAMPRIVVYTTDLRHAAAVAPFFLVASCLRLYRDRLRIDLALGVILVFLPTVLLGGNPFLAPLLWLTLPYALIAFCESDMPVLRESGRWGDMSYGVYLISFPVQQVLAQFMTKQINVYLYIASATLVTMPLAWLSWHFVEKRALALKPNGRAKVRKYSLVNAIAS